MTTETWHRVAWQEGNPRTGHSVDHATERAAQQHEAALRARGFEVVAYPVQIEPTEEAV